MLTPLFDCFVNERLLELWYCSHSSIQLIHVMNPVVVDTFLQFPTNTGESTGFRSGLLAGLNTLIKIRSSVQNTTLF